MGMKDPADPESFYSSYAIYLFFQLKSISFVTA